LTATLAGQGNDNLYIIKRNDLLMLFLVIMSGFLGMTTRPWIRRIVTRLIAIAPAMVAACVAGRSGLSNMLVASQVALSIQLPFAVVPLVYLTSRRSTMKLDLVVEGKEVDSIPLVTEQAKMSLIDRLVSRLRFSRSKSDWTRFPQFSKLNKRAVKDFFVQSSGQGEEEEEERPSSDSSIEEKSNNHLTIVALPEPLVYANGKVTKIVSVLIALLLIGLNGYLVVSLFMQI
jgi:Mn2+/Fe2+ NRAMP family transporter